MGRRRKAELELARYHKRRNDAILKLGGKCANCGSTDNLEIDHIDPSKKSFTVSQGINRTDLWDELSKCQILCKVCHLDKTFGETRKKRQHGTWAMYRRGRCRCQICRDFFNSYRRELRRRKSRFEP